MPTRPTRRTPEQKIADLKAEIERIKLRAARQKLKTDPALRHISGAMRAIDKALRESQDHATRAALTEARATLSACLALNAAAPSDDRGALVPKRRLLETLDADRVLDYVRKHPSSRSEAICADLGTDPASLRQVLRQLRDEGKIKVEGRARATSYSSTS